MILKHTLGVTAITTPISAFDVRYMTDAPRTHVAPEIDDIYAARYMDIPTDAESFEQVREEMERRGINAYNGMMSSCPYFHMVTHGDTNELVLFALPTRYAWGMAARDLAEEQNISLQQFRGVSPNMLGASGLLMVEDDIEGVRKPALVGQIKGDTLGSGQVHAALVGGGVSGQALAQTEDPLVATINCESIEELGIRKRYETRPVTLLNEGMTGQINAVHQILPGQLTLSEVLESFDDHSRGLLERDQRLEVDGIAIIPLDAEFLQTGSHGAQHVRCKAYQATSGGLQVTSGVREVRPYTAGLLSHLQTVPRIEEYLTF